MRLYDNEGYREEFMALVYDLLHSDGTNDRANQIIDAFDMAPTVEAEPLFPNDPLTLEELREMYYNEEGPVWVNAGAVFVPAVLDIYDGALVAVWSALGIDTALLEQDYGKTWVAYRRKPEEVDTCQKTSSLSG